MIIVEKAPKACSKYEGALHHADEPLKGMLQG